MPSTYGSSRSRASGTIESPTSGEASSLPGDEFRRLQKRQQTERLNAYFGQSHLPPSYTAIRPKTSYQQANIPRERRVAISEVSNATRLALGASFNFTDESYRSQRIHTARPTTSDAENLTPQRYIEEFNKKWAEDDAKYEHQTQADYTFNAGWRTHAGMYVDTKPLPAPRRDRFEAGRPVRFDTYSQDEPRPLARAVPAILASRFSFESEEAEPRRSFWGRFV
jgi:hypothetical protein